MPQKIRIHRHKLSGHCHRVELFASLAGIEHEFVEVDLVNGEHLREPFLTLNPFGQVPVIEDGDVVLADANAILVYLAKRYAPDWLPEDPIGAAEVQRFLSSAAGEVAHGACAARLVTVFGMDRDIERAQAIADWFHQRLEAHLSGRDWLVGDRPTVADVAIYSYTAHAPEGNVSLEPYPTLRAWLTRVEGLDGFVPMERTPAGLAA